MQDYLAFHFQVTAEFQDVIIAGLYDLGFESFVEEDEKLQAFISQSDWNQIDQEAFKWFCSNHGLSYQIIVHNPKDWNAIWEANFQPIVLANTLRIRAPFHSADPSYSDELIIAPKMAFGTGHHATTALILEWMTGETFNGLSVLDFGCGTGILGIYAKKKGCRNLVMIDIELQAVENAFEHCELNHVHADAILEGSAEVIPAQLFDIIFANITRNVLEELLPKLRSHCTENGKLIISGFLKQDELFMISCLEKNQFRVKSTFQKEDWIAILADVI